MFSGPVGRTVGFFSLLNLFACSEYVFDAIPMILLVIVYTIVPPGAYVSMGLRQQLKNEHGRNALQGNTDTGSYPMDQAMP